MKVSGGDSVADEHCPPDLGRLRDAGNLGDRLHAGELAGRYISKEVIKRQHGVGLAAPEVGLQLNDRVTALSS